MAYNCSYDGEERAWTNMKMMKKLTVVFLICCLACSLPVFASEGGKTDSEDNAAYTEMVNKAIEVLAEEWNRIYSDDIYADAEYLVDIRNTRIIRIKDTLTDRAEESFGDKEYVIEFLMFDDYMSAGVVPQGGHCAGYYDYSGVFNNVVVYKDGRMECQYGAINAYRNRTFECDYSTFIDEVIDLRDQFNQVIRFKDHQIIREE